MTTEEEFANILKKAPVVVPSYRVAAVPKDSKLNIGDILYLYDDGFRFGSINSKECFVPLSCVEFVGYTMISKSE